MKIQTTVILELTDTIASAQQAMKDTVCMRSNGPGTVLIPDADHPALFRAIPFETFMSIDPAPLTAQQKRQALELFRSLYAGESA